MPPTPDPIVNPLAPDTQALARQHRRLAAVGEAPWLHAEIGRRLADKLGPILLTPDSWLDWSGALGGGTDAVDARYPQAKRWVHEPLALLADRAAERWLAANARPWWAAWKKPPQPPILRRADLKPEGWPADGVGMLWANMSLHSSSDVDALLSHWHALLKTEGFLMCSGLGPDTARELNAVYRVMGWGLPTIKFIDMHDLGDAMVQAGFADPVMDMERLTLTWADADAMLAELRSWGGNVAQGRFGACRTPRWRARLLDELAHALRRPDGRLGMTIEVVYGHAVKPQPKWPVQTETRVSLDDMKRMIKVAKS